MVEDQSLNGRVSADGAASCLTRMRTGRERAAQLGVRVRRAVRSSDGENAGARRLAANRRRTYAAVR